MKRIDLTGTTKGKLFIIKAAPSLKCSKGRSYTRWFCRCNCGTEFIVLTNNLAKQKGCKDCRKVTHGLSKHPMYNVWWDMIDRCYNTNNSWYHRYGGRGIRVKSIWRNPVEKQGLVNFFEWNKNLPKNKQWRKGLQLDRINNSGNYKPSNCRWVTPKENSNNRG
jgi:hypothetical protein